MPRKLILAMAALGVGYWALKQQAIKNRQWQNFTGRTVLITGGSRGLGLELARVYAAEGAYVILCARDAQELANAAEALRDISDSVEVVVCDVMDRGEIERMVGLIESDFGAVDVLVNNAGIIQAGPAETMSLDDYERAMDTHFWGPLHLIRAVHQRMRERGGGRIVNIASFGGKVPVPHMLPYTASKFALVGLSEGYRSELAADRIYVTTVCPGLMRTGSVGHVEFKGDHSAESHWFLAGASLPGFSADAAHAAQGIVAACKRGDAELIIGLPAKLAAKLYGIAPEEMSRLLTLVARMLPAAEGASLYQTRKGSDLLPGWVPRWLRYQTARAAVRNNQVAPYRLHSS